jgi:hypothetical protein
MSLIRSISMVVLLLTCSIAYSEVSSKGVGEVKYSGWKSPSSEDVIKAKELARVSAVSRWASSQGGSFLKNYDEVRNQIEADISEYVLSDSIITEKINKEAKTYKVVLKVAVDDVRLKNLISDSSVISNVSDGDKSYMTFVFVSRRQTSVQSYDAKVYKRKDASNQENGKEIEQGSAQGVAYSSEFNQSSSVTTGGSTTLKSDKISYDVASSDEINVAMSQVFSTSGFEIVEAEYLEEETEGLLSVEAFKDDFRNGDDISGKTRRNAAKGAKMVDVPYIAVGTLDIGIKEIDSATGLVRVNVTVTGKMISLKKRFPKTVASVGPVLIAGLGPNQTVAERNALKKASEAAATELVNQLNSKSVI